MKKARVYARYSDHNQDEGFSIEYQMQECQEYMAKHGIHLEKAHIDEALSAKKVAGRDAFFELIHDIKAGYVDTVIVYKFNRIFRNAYESHKYRKLFKKYSVKLISVTQQIDDDTSAGRLMINVLSDIDQYQSETISDHVKSGMREMARQGYFTGGTVPFGYKTVVVEAGKKPRKKYEPDEEEAIIVQTLFVMYAKGYSLRDLQDYTIKHGIHTRQGKAFGITTLARMLANDFYIGTLRYKTQGYDPIVVLDAVPAIIDMDTWHQVQARKEANKLLKPRKRKDIYALTGKITCGLCGSHFFGMASGSTQKTKKYYYKYYVCAKRKGYQACSCDRIRKDTLEDYVLDQIKKQVLNPEAIDQLSERIEEICTDSPDNIRHHLKQSYKEKASLEDQISQLIDLKLTGKISETILLKKTAELEAKLSSVDLRIHSLESQQKNAITADKVKAYLNEMLANSDTADDAVLKNLFDNFVEKITIDNDMIDLVIKVNPLSPIAYKQPTGQPQVILYASKER